MPCASRPCLVAGARDFTTCFVLGCQAFVLTFSGGAMPDPDLSRPPPPISAPARTPPESHADLVLLVVPLRRFNLGQLVITANAQGVLAPEEVSSALARHSRGDWGDVCAEDRQTNDLGVVEQGMILSAYQSSKGVKFWVITDPGHEVTTFLLPEDY